MAFQVCFIGCGRQAHKAYAEPLCKYRQAHPDTVLKCCCDVNLQAAEEFAQSVGFESFDSDYEAMLKREKPDAVILVTPFVVTASIARKVLSMGIPALIEKPLGVNTQEAETIAEAAAQSGTPNQVAFNRRHMPLIRALLGEIGGKPVCHIDYRMHRANRRETYFHTTAIHGLDVVEYLAGGSCERMDCAYQQIAGQESGVVNMQLLARYQSGATASMSFCPVAGLVCEQLCVALNHETIFVDLPVWGARGNEGYLEHYVDGQLLLRKTGLEISDGPSMPDSNGFTYQLTSFLDDIRAGARPKDDILTGIDAMRLADCLAARKPVYTAE